MEHFCFIFYAKSDALLLYVTVINYFVSSLSLPYARPGAPFISARFSLTRKIMSARRIVGREYVYIHTRPGASLWAS